jgi:hypothetical protein
MFDQTIASINYDNIISQRRWGQRSSSGNAKTAQLAEVGSSTAKVATMEIWAFFKRACANLVELSTVQLERWQVELLLYNRICNH